MFIISTFFPSFSYRYLCFLFDLIIEFIQLICLLMYCFLKFLFFLPFFSINILLPSFNKINKSKPTPNVLCPTSLPPFPPLFFTLRCLISPSSYNVCKQWPLTIMTFLQWLVTIFNSKTMSLCYFCSIDNFNRWLGLVVICSVGYHWIRDLGDGVDNFVAAKKKKIPSNLGISFNPLLANWYMHT